MIRRSRFFCSINLQINKIFYSAHTANKNRIKHALYVSCQSREIPHVSVQFLRSKLGSATQKLIIRSKVFLLNQSENKFDIYSAHTANAELKFSSHYMFYVSHEKHLQGRQHSNFGSKKFQYFLKQKPPKLGSFAKPRF